jgi:hypothetical protein
LQKDEKIEKENIESSKNDLTADVKKERKE